jgi:hypothetical protein
MTVRIGFSTNQEAALEVIPIRSCVTYLGHGTKSNLDKWQYTKVFRPNVTHSSCSLASVAVD